MWFLFGEVSSSSGCLGWATLFYCGTPWAFHIIIVKRHRNFDTKTGNWEPQQNYRLGTVSKSLIDNEHRCRTHMKVQLQLCQQTAQFYMATFCEENQCARFGYHMYDALYPNGNNILLASQTSHLKNRIKAFAFSMWNILMAWSQYKSVIGEQWSGFTS